MAEDAPVQPARSRVRVVMANRQRGATKQMTGRDQRELAAAHRGEPGRTVSRSDHFSSIVFENHITHRGSRQWRKPRYVRVRGSPPSPHDE